MPKAKQKTIGANLEEDNMDNWTLSKLKDYLREKDGRVTGSKKQLLLIAKCYKTYKEVEDQTIISQWEIFQAYFEFDYIHIKHAHGVRHSR